MTSSHRMTHVVPAPRSGRKALPSEARRYNRSLLFASLLRVGPMSRADLARASELTAAAASSVVSSLIDDGLVEEVGRRSAGVGKPATLLGVVADARHALCLDLSDERDFVGGIVNLAGKVVHRESVQRNGAQGDEAVDMAISLARSLAQRADRPILGIGCGCPGVIDSEGTVQQAVDLQWHDVRLAGQLEQATGFRTWVVNDANAATLAEYSFGARTSPNLVLVRVARGVGAGIILHGELFVGDHHAAGEIGHVTVVDDGTACRCGRFGCLETVVSAPLLAAQLDDNPEGHDETLALAGKHLGVALATLISTLDLNQIVLSGPIDLLDDRVRSAALATIKRRTMPDVGDRARLTLSTLGDNDVLLGAAALVLRNELGVA